MGVHRNLPVTIKVFHGLLETSRNLVAISIALLLTNCDKPERLLACRCARHSLGNRSHRSSLTQFGLLSWSRHVLAMPQIAPLRLDPPNQCLAVRPQSSSCLPLIAHLPYHCKLASGLPMLCSRTFSNCCSLPRTLKWTVLFATSLLILSLLILMILLILICFLILNSYSFSSQLSTELPCVPEGVGLSPFVDWRVARSVQK